MDIENKIKELRLIPLFPDKNFDYTSFFLEDDANVIEIADLRKEANLRFQIRLFYSKKDDKYYVSGRVNNYYHGEDFLEIDEKYADLGFADAINKYNFYYEELAKKFNELLLKTLKEELEKEKQKAEEQEQGGDEQGGDEQGGDEQGGDEQGGDEQDGDEQGGDEQDGEGQDGEGGKMSSKDIQNLIDQLDKQLDNSDSNGQSNDSGVDLEDFLNKVNDGEIDNDFTKHYKDEGLKRDINEQMGDDNEFPQEIISDDADNQNYSSVANALKESFKIDDSELKRRFPNPDFVKDFIGLLSKKEVDALSDKVGIEKDLTTLEKKNKLSVNLITEIQNL